MLISDLVHTAPVRAALAAHDITTAYRLLIEGGATQREIARATGQTQSEVSDIRKGRKVYSVWVLERIADGLGVPRAVMGLGGGATGRYAEPETAPSEEVSEDVKRRAFLLAAGAAVVNSPALGELLLNIPVSNAVAPLPARVYESDVIALRNLTSSLRLVARQYGGQAEATGRIAHRSAQLLAVGGTDTVKKQLGAALAELHTEAGWCCFDSGLNREAQDYFGRALQLAGQAEDPFQMSYTARHAGITMAERGAPDDGLKLFQLGQVKLGELPRDDPQATALDAWMHLESAVAFARMGRGNDATYELARAREGWRPPDAFEDADMNHGAAWVNTELGNLDSAESFARSSLAVWSRTNDSRDAVKAQINLACIYLQAREPGGLELAQTAVATVAGLRSRRARERLAPLGAALARRKDSTAQDLTRRVRELQAV